MRILFIIMAFMLNMLCSEASEINFNDINDGEVQEFQPKEEDENGTKYITFKVGNDKIKFPKDGKQPDIKDAVGWSCAKISDEKITNWYLKMFGIIDRDGTPSTDDEKYIKAGFSREGIDRIIKINMHRQIDDAYQEPEPKDIMLQDCRKAIDQYLNARDINEFKKYVVSTFVQNITSIASNPVGRLLLYRLLIEIRRTQGGVGCLEGDNKDQNTLNYEMLESNNKDLLERRNRMRAIIVNFMSAFGFDDDNGVLAFSLYQPELILLNTTNNQLLAETCEPDVAIVHEMVHWYQRLRHPSRVDSEHNATSISAFVCNTLQCEVDTNSSSSYINDICTEIYWPNKSGDAFNVCEFRTVFGISSKDSRITYSGNSFENGDEISENLYRFFKNKKIRFVYVEKTEHIDQDLIECVNKNDEHFDRYVNTLEAVTKFLKSLKAVGQ